MGTWPNQCTNLNQGGYSWWAMSGEIWNCMDSTFMPFSVLPGCRVSCQPCRQDDFGSLMAHLGVPKKQWKTWLRPAKAKESRRADGRYHWPVSGEPFLYNDAGGHYELAVCTEVQPGNAANRFRNLWDKSICNCVAVNAPGVCVIPDNLGCVEMLGRFSPCWIHTSSDWPPDFNEADIQCLGKFLGGGPLSIVFLPTRLNNVSMVRVNAGNAGARINPGSYSTNPQEFGCTPHWNALCWGLQSEGTSECAVPNEVNYFHAAYQAWNFLRLLTLAPRWWDEPNGAGLEPAAVKAKNRVLQWITQRKSNMPPMPNGTLQNLDQVDRDFTTTDYWRRAWNQHPQLLMENTPNLPLTDVPMDGAQAGNVWENCYLRYSGHRVRVKYVPYDIFVGVSAQFLHEDQRPLCGPPITTAQGRRYAAKAAPLIRIEMRVRMALLAEFADDDPPVKQLTNPNQPVSGGLHTVVLGINNPETAANPGRRAPVIVAADTGQKHVDELVYVDNTGRTFKRQPPLEFTWIGEQSPFRDYIDDLYPPGYFEGPPNSVPRDCCALIDIMNPPGGHRVRAAYTDREWQIEQALPSNVDPDALREEMRTRGMRGSVRLAVGLPVQPGC